MFLEEHASSTQPALPIQVFFTHTIYRSCLLDCNECIIDNTVQGSFAYTAGCLALNQRIDF